MRKPVEIRRAAAWGCVVALAFALAVGFIVFLLLGRSGRLGFGGINAAGLVEGAAFVLAYNGALIYIRNALRVPTVTLLSFGLLGPPTAGRAAEAVPVVEADEVLHTLAENRIVIVRQVGVPIGLGGLRRDRITSWEELVKVQAGVAFPELRSVLAHEQLVVVTEGGAVRGIITQEMFLTEMWGPGH